MKDRTRNRVAAMAGSIVLLLAACGGTGTASAPTLPSLTDDSVGAAPTSTTAAVDPEDAMREYAACMRGHGVDMPDPTANDGGSVVVGGGNESEFAAFEDANKECSPILEGAFGDFELTPEQLAESRDQQLAIAQCMRDQGFDWPDPASDGGMTAIEFGDDVDIEAVNAAMQVCSEEVFGELSGPVGVSGVAGVNVAPGITGESTP